MPIGKVSIFASRVRRDLPCLNTFIYRQLHFPIEDVVKNVKQFVTAVKRVTGNQKDTEEKGKSKSVKPGEFLYHFDLFRC
jgi:hypothetical protein